MILQRTNKYNGFLRIDELTYQGKNGKEITREVVDRKNAVAALVFNTLTKKYVFASQWRPGPGREFLELPAGMLDHAAEGPEACITREIEEETGYKTDSVKLIAEGFVSPGYTTERMMIYFAEVSQKTGKGGGVAGEDEEVEVIEMSREEMLAAKFDDLKTIIAVNWSKQNHSF